MAAKIEKRVTSADVARKAGVARSTVSYVLNQTPHQTIPESTRTRVMDAAAELGYTPSAAARTLKRGRSDVVLCLLQPWPLGSAAGALMAELTTAFAEQGLTLVTHISGKRIADLERVWNEISPAAVLSYHAIDGDVETTMRSAGVRSVMVLFSEELSGTAHMTRVDSRIGRMQAEHLIGGEHVHIGYAYPEQPQLKAFAEPRLQGVASACAQSGFLPPDVRIVGLDAASAASAIAHWRSLDRPVTAVCAYNDEVAQALLAGARLAKVQVPGELAIIGADDIPAAALTSPPLTTIAIDHVAEARRIVDTVTAAIAGKAPASKVDAADLFTMVVRQTT